MKLVSIGASVLADRMRFHGDVERRDATRLRITFDVSPVFAVRLDRADPFVLPCLLMAMERGEDLEIAPPVSARLFHNATTSLVTILARMLAMSGDTRVTAQRLVSDTYAGSSAVITGFSGGIDSFMLLKDYYLDAPIPAYRVTHLLFNDIGSHGSNLDDRHGTERDRARAIHAGRLARIQGIADELQLPLIRVRSNLDELIAHSYPSTYTVRDASVALLLQSFASRFLYASSYHYDHVFVGETTDMAHADPILLPLCSTESMDCASVGGQYTRTLKTDLVAQMPLARRALDVCWLPDGDTINCGHCEKCKRTLLTLEILGRLPDLAPLFNLAAWATERGAYITSVLASGNPFHVEIVTLAEARGYALE